MFSKHFLFLLLSSFLFSACGAKKPATFSDDSDNDITPYVDQYANTPINVTKNYPLNQEFSLIYKTYHPDKIGSASFKARSIKEVPAVADRQPQEGKKLVLVEISVKGDSKNEGSPATFNQIGDTPSPQFVLIDKNNHKSYVEETYYSDAYTQEKKLFELSQITLDQSQWVNTAIVFQIDKSLAPDLALRFVNVQGKTEFYDLTQ